MKSEKKVKSNEKKRNKRSAGPVSSVSAATERSSALWIFWIWSLLFISRSVALCTGRFVCWQTVSVIQSFIYTHSAEYTSPDTLTHAGTSMTLYFFISLQRQKTIRAGQTGSSACWRGRSHCVPHCFGLSSIIHSTKHGNSDPWGARSSKKVQTDPRVESYSHFKHLSSFLLLYRGWGGLSACYYLILAPTCLPRLALVLTSEGICVNTAALLTLKPVVPLNPPSEILEGAPPPHPALLLLRKNTHVYAAKQKPAINVVSALER